MHDTCRCCRVELGSLEGSEGLSSYQNATVDSRCRKIFQVTSLTETMSSGYRGCGRRTRWLRMLSLRVDAHLESIGTDWSDVVGSLL